MCFSFLSKLTSINKVISQFDVKMLAVSTWLDGTGDIVFSFNAFLLLYVYRKKN